MGRGQLPESTGNRLDRIPGRRFFLPEGSAGAKHPPRSRKPRIDLRKWLGLFFQLTEGNVTDL